MIKYSGVQHYNAFTEIWQFLTYDVIVLNELHMVSFDKKKKLASDVSL